MATIYDCNNPKDGWSLCHHFIGGILMVIRALVNEIKQSDDEDEKEQLKRKISDEEARLIGKIFIVMLRMNDCGFHEDADYMQDNMDTIARTDLLDLADIEVISSDSHIFTLQAPVENTDGTVTLVEKELIPLGFKLVRKIGNPVKRVIVSFLGTEYLFECCCTLHEAVPSHVCPLHHEVPEESDEINLIKKIRSNYL